MKGFLLFLALIIVGGAGYLLYLDYNKPSTSVQNPRLEPIALVESKENDVKRQSSENPAWENIEVLAPLFSDDILKTQKSSTAHIKTNDGLVIQVRENTLLSISKLPEGPDIDLKTGDIFSQNITPAVEFSTRGAILRGDMADIHVTTDTNGKSHVELTKGKAFIIDKAKTRVDLSSNESADLNEGILQGPKGASTPAASTPIPTPSLKTSKSPLELLKPGFGVTLNLEPENDNIEFDWTSSIPSKLFIVELSTSSDFKKIVQSHTVNSTKDTIKDLKPQKYFWRVRAFDTKNKPLATSKSSAFNLKVPLKTLPELVSPAAEITWTDSSPIEFSWRKMDTAAKYRFAIYKDLSQKNEVKSQVTDANTFIWNWQTPRSYYWTVRGLNSRGTVISQSEVRHLTIKAQGKEKLPTFVIISPKDETEVIRDLSVEKPETIPFQWRVTKTLPGPLSLIISSDPEFKNPMTLKNVTKSLVPVTLKKEGIYYWNLSSQSEDGRDLELSPVITFNLKSLGTLAAPKLIEPANESKIETEEPKVIKFVWKPAKNAVQYHLVLKRIDPTTKEPFIVLDKMVKETTLTSDALENGSYTWNVFSHDAKENEKGLDKEFAFDLAAPNQMDSPKLKEPVVK